MIFFEVAFIYVCCNVCMHVFSSWIISTDLCTFVMSKCLLGYWPSWATIELQIRTEI